MPVTLDSLLEVMHHELNSIRTVLQLWDAEIPQPVKRSISRRVQSQERMLRILKRLVKKENLAAVSERT